MNWHVFLYLISFIGIWFGAGLAISTVEKISRQSRLSYFAVSYLILGFFTSSSEISVGINALLDKDPQIFVGNLIGASIVLFLLVIPLLAVTGSRIHISDELKGNKSILPLIVVSLPVFLALDGRLTKADGVVAVIFYVLSTLFIETRKLRPVSLQSKLNQKGRVTFDLLKILLGISIVFVSSKIIVDQTVYFSNILGVSPFLISLLLISVGTNVPEISLVFRSLFKKSNQVAFGDFVGSASVNTFLLGLFTFLNGSDIILGNSYSISLLILVLAVVLFFLFARSKNTISRFEGFLMFLLYVAFIVFEVVTHL